MKIKTMLLIMQIAVLSLFATQKVTLIEQNTGAT